MNPISNDGSRLVRGDDPLGQMVMEALAARPDRPRPPAAAPAGVARQAHPTPARRRVLAGAFARLRTVWQA